MLNIVGTEDDLVPASSSAPLSDIILSKDKKLIEFQSGHVEPCVDSYAHNSPWPQAVKWLQERLA